MSIGDIIGIGGALLGASESASEGESFAAAAEYNGKLARKNAQAAKRQAGFEADRIRDQGRKVLGAQRAAYGASGVTMEGSAADVLEATAMDIEMDAQLAKYAGEVQADAYEDEAVLFGLSGGAAKSAGYTNAFTSILGGLSTQSWL